MIILSEFYKQLIEPIPHDLSIIDVIQGEGWTLVESELGAGLAMTYKGGLNTSLYKNWIGHPVKNLALQVNSWNFLEASLGLAAINSFWNTKITLENKFGDYSLETKLHLLEYLDAAQQANKKIVSVGHFPFLDKLNQKVTILEMNPIRANEYPSTAAEYLIPGCNIILITGSTVINKTFESISRLIGGSTSWLIGPSTPLTPQFKNYRIDFLGSLLVQDSKLVKQLIRSGAKRELMTCAGIRKTDVTLR